MNRLQTNPRIAFVDLTFNWPPVGGCWIDALHVMEGLQRRGAEVCLFTPRFTEYYPRGDVREPIPVDHVSIPFTRYTFTAPRVIERFRARVGQFEPDLVFVMDGYHMKNHILTALDPRRCILRFYAYEMLCVNLHYYRYHENRICDQGYIHNPRECHRCWFQRMPSWGRALQIALGWKETHPRLHFSQEYLGSQAGTAEYHERLLENFRNLLGAIVYNPMMSNQVSPYVDAVHQIPSGVDTSRFVPASSPPRNDPVRFFLPGRANDPLKGLDTLIRAGDILQARGVAFEVHYTAAMDCPTQRPWLINRGWVRPEELPSFYQEMDVVVVPSTWIEPFGITALEGMASGLPVVASNHGGLQISVSHEETGFLFEPGNANELAQCLETLARDAPRRRLLGEQGRRRVETVFDWNCILDRHYVPLVEQSLQAIRQNADGVQPS